MPFLHPLLFTMGAIGVSVPILIHILNRRRHKIVDWAAMKFLLAALQKNKRRLQIEELIILLIRCLIVLVLGIMLARFLGCSPSDPTQTSFTGQRTLVYVLDDSASMGQTQGNIHSFAVAKEDLIKEVEKASANDEIAIILASDISSKKAFKTLKTKVDKKRLVERIKNLTTSDVSRNLGMTIQEAGRFFLNAKGEKQLVIFSDFRNSDLKNAEITGKITPVLRELHENENVKFAFMGYGRPVKKNLTVESIRKATPFALLKNDSTIDVEVIVRNNGQENETNIPLTLKTITREKDGKLKEFVLPQKRITAIEKGGVAKVLVSVKPSRLGFFTVEASVPDTNDELKADNIARVSIDVKKAIRVLIIDGNYVKPGSRHNSSYYLETALDPYGRADHGFSVEVKKPAELNGIIFDDYQIVCFTNVANFPMQTIAKTKKTKKADDSETPSADVVNKLSDAKKYPAIARLEEYVKKGGAVVFFAGDNVDVKFYNKYLFKEKDETGLLPLKLSGFIGHADEKDTCYKIDSDRMKTDGFMSFFASGFKPTVKWIRIYRMMDTAVKTTREFKELEAKKESAAVITEKLKKQLLKQKVFVELPDRVTVEAFIIAAGDDCVPLIVSKSTGTGISIMITTSASDAWTNWPTVMETRLYPLFFRRVAEKIAKAQVDKHNLFAGSPLDMMLDEELADSSATILAPGIGQIDQPLTVNKVGTTGHIAYNNMNKAGVYEVVLKKPDQTQENMMIVRNLNPVEGKLALSPRKGIEALTPSDAETVYINRVADSQGKDLAELGAKKQYWMWFAFGLLGLMCLESTLGLKFGHWRK